MNDLPEVLDVEAAAAVDPGTSLLVSGPAMAGKSDVVRSILASGLRNGEGAVCVTTGGTTADVIADLEARVDDLVESHVAVVDCRERDSPDGDAAPEGAHVHHVGAPSDLTGIGIGITRSFERLHQCGVDRGYLSLDSLSTMLTYTDRKAVFKFCHVLSSRLDQAEFLGLFSVDTSAHDDRTVQVIKQAFDGMIEIRERDGDREARLRGVEPNPSDWVAV